ncbi:hypothetical protein RhiirA4_394375, partial [Rhizophagus irregularis]
TSPVSPDAKTCRSIFGTVIIIVANGQSCILLVNMIDIEYGMTFIVYGMNGMMLKIGKYSKYS